MTITKMMNRIGALVETAKDQGLELQATSKGKLPEALFTITYVLKEKDAVIMETSSQHDIDVYLAGVIRGREQAGLI